MPDPKLPSPGGWRDIGGKAEDPAKRQRGWQQNAPAAGAAKKPMSKNAKRIIAILSISMLCIAVVVVVKWLRPFKASLVVIGSGYEKNLLLPHNVHGWNGAKALHGVANVESYGDLRFWQQPPGIRSNGEPRQLQPGSSWKDIWLDISKNLPEETAVIFVSLHGLADKNDAYLLSNDPSSESWLETAPGKRSRIPFKEVLDSIRELDKNRKKIVLLLDVCHMDSHWPIGLLHNEFVARLQEKYKSEIEEMGNLVVICGAGPDQRAWVSDEWQNSMFTHFVTEGLRGAAGNLDDNITAQKLFDYVEKKVSQWAQTNRAHNQTPIMIAKKGLPEKVAIMHITAPYTEKSPQEAPGRNFTKEQQDALRKEWQKWRELRELAPYAFAPQRWRLYEANLLRFEQLIRAGDPTDKAGDLRGRLADLEKEIRMARTLTAALDALVGSIPMGPVLGYEPIPADEMTKVYGKLLASDDDKARRELLAVWKDKFPQERQYVQLQLSSSLVHQLEKSGNTETPSSLLKLQEAIEAGLPLTRRPAEAQLLKMLGRQMLRPDQQIEAVKLALDTRVQAEQTALSATGKLPAYLYSEVIFPWTRSRVDRADIKRRDGEDLLFGDPLKHLGDAKNSLLEANVIYKETQKEIVKIREALAERDEACCDLPYLAQWLAMAPFGGEARGKAPDANAKPFHNEMKVLRDDLTILGDKLVQLRRAVDSAEAPPKNLADLTRSVRSSHLAIRDKYHEMSKGYTATIFQRNWHDIENALSIPCTRSKSDDVELRLGLLDKLRKVSRGLAEADLKNQVEETESSLVSIKRQTEMLQASFRPYEGMQIEGELAFNEKLQGDLFKMASIINKKADIVDGTDAALSDAANLCRGIPAGLAENVNARPFYPVEWLRRKRTHELFRWQAERTWKDHWFDPGELPGREDAYYMNAGQAYIKAATELIKDYSNVELVKKLRGEMDTFERNKLVVARLKGPEDATVTWTSAQREYPLNWKIDIDGNVPKGEPMRWSELSNPDRLSKRKKIDWPSVEGEPLRAEFPLSQEEVWGSEVRDTRQLSLHAVYRGQHLVHSVKFKGQEPDVIVREPARPANSWVAARMDANFNYGAISILLDNSGSMLWAPNAPGPMPAPKPGEARWDFAVKALKHVLEQIPDGTELTIFTFTNDPKDEICGTGIKALLREPTRWDKTQTDAFMQSLKSLARDPKFFDNNSPICRGLLTCKERGFRKDFNGSQVIVALTDGSDNLSFSKNPALNKKMVGAELEESNRRDPNIDVVVVCFMDEKNSEYADALVQFGGVKYFKGVKEGKSRSKFVTQPDGPRLGATILEMIRPRLELYYPSGGPVSGFEYPEHAIDLPSSPPRWVSVAPNRYVAKLPQIAHTSQNLILDPALNQFLVLKNKNRELFLERGLLFKQPEVASGRDFSVPRKDWQVTLLGHGIDGKNNLEQLIIFENTDTDSPRALQAIEQPQPDFVWLELEAEGKIKPLRWEHTYDVAAPAYRLSMSVDRSKWEAAKSRPKLRAWFWPQSTGSINRQSELVERSFLESKTGTIDKAFKLTGTEGLPTWETRNNRKALVVQCAFKPGQPVMVRFENPPSKTLEVEHLFFNEAGRYTACFYGLDDSFSGYLTVVNVAAFKEHAQTEYVVFPGEGTRLPEIIVPPAVFVPGRFTK